MAYYYIVTWRAGGTGYECPHAHRTYTGALRCSRRGSRSDGTAILRQDAGGFASWAGPTGSEEEASLLRRPARQAS